MGIIGTIVFFILAFVLMNFLYERIMRKYWSRPCMGKHWKNRFPKVPKTEIRAFLALFVDSFAFSKAKHLKFEPNDRILDVYQTMYPPNWQFGDQLECEMLVTNMKKTYGVDLETIWRKDLTLGEAFELTRKKK